MIRSVGAFLNYFVSIYAKINFAWILGWRVRICLADANHLWWEDTKKWINSQLKETTTTQNGAETYLNVAIGFIRNKRNVDWEKVTCVSGDRELQRAGRIWLVDHGVSPNQTVLVFLVRILSIALLDDRWSDVWPSNSNRFRVYLIDVRQINVFVGIRREYLRNRDNNSYILELQVELL